MKITLIATVLVSALTTTSVFASDNNWEKEASDAWIDGKAEATLLFNGELNNFDINTDVKNGVVVLTGEVERSVDKKLAEELVLGIDGVKKVKNELTILDIHKKADSKEDSSAFTDAKIATVIKSRYLFDTDVDGTDIDVDVERRVVTLNGHVASEAERDLAIQIAKNANDVLEVEDNLRISSKS